MTKTFFGCPNCGNPTLSILPGYEQDKTYLIGHYTPVQEALCFTCGKGAKLKSLTAAGAAVDYAAGRNIVWSGHIPLSEQDRAMLMLDDS